MTTNNIHWTSDEELLSRFVLHQLPQSEEELLTTHLRECEKCRQAVAGEKQLAAGVKFAGRSAMKQRLSNILNEDIKITTGQRAPHQIPWTRVASLAAVLVILISVGVYNDWFQSKHLDVSAPAEQVAQEQAPQRSDAREKDVAQSTAKRDATVSDKASVEEHAGKAHLMGSKERRDVPLDDARTHNEKIQLPSSGANPSVFADGSLMKMKEAENGAGLASEAIDISPQEFWVEGYVISSETADEKKGLAAAKHEAYNSVDDKNSPLQKDYRQRLQNPSQSNYPAAIFLSQKPSSMLPVSQQSKQGAARAVQTLVEQKMGNLQMTLYLDSPLPADELKSANIQTVGADSLILNFSNQRIGYRLPPVLNQKVNSNARQVK